MASLEYINAAAALLLASVAALQALRGGHPARWGAAAFAALAVALLIAALDAGGGEEWVGKALVCVLLAFPYLLLRFTVSLGAVPVRFLRPATAATVGILVATVALPPLPEEGAQPAWAVAYIVVVLAFWTVLSLATIVGLWRGGTGQPTLARRRVRLMSAATGGLNALILLAGMDAVDVDNDAALAVQGLLAVTLVAFAVGFAPPRIVRVLWRLPEQDELRRATEEMVGAIRVSEVTATLLPQIARVVGASGAALYDGADRLVASFGRVPALEHGAAPPQHAHAIETIPLSPPFGALVVATNPLTPFFGREEIGLLRALGAIVDLSLARCALGERERERQLALRDAMEQAKQANTAKSDFLSRMSHELRTPLNVVLGFGQILEMRGSLTPKDREAVDSILKAGRHLLDLINEVLDLSTIESGRMAISPEPVDIAELATEAIDLIGPLAQDRSVQLTAELEACHHVTADRQRLKQVLLNLLSNGVKYNHDGGRVTISCAEGEQQGRLRLAVADTGPGVPAALMGRLFEPFDRLGAEARQAEGTGLGLALSRQLMQLMGGEIGAHSREGEGSTFWIELPLALPPRNGAAPEPSGESEEQAVRASARRRVLLIEDNLANLKVIQALTAERPEIEVLPAMTGRLGLELAREHRPDLILLDRHLPDLSGGEVLHRLKADPETRTIPIVIVTADATPGQVRRMRELGADDYVTKPLDIARFGRVLDGIFEPQETVS